MRANANPAPIRKDKRRLLESCAIAAGIAALAYGGPALAQVAGSGVVTSLPANTTAPPIVNPSTVNVTGAQSIIDWTPSNAPAAGVIDFLPSTNTLTFVGDTLDYVVLNRFVGTGTNVIGINGDVSSISSIPGLPTRQEGNIWFYNAGGILIGADSTFNVGSLVLTTNAIDTSGNSLFGPSGEIRFGGTPGSVSSVTINGTINAANELISSTFDGGSAYVAVVAPRIVQAGIVRVDGSAAYVAAEVADITINNGLFDISVAVGAEGGNVITHTGRTIGPAHEQGDTDQSRVYMVAIPKNEAVTMLVSGQVGYDDAAVAQLDPDGAVVLSAGYNIQGGGLAAAPVNATAANITVNDTIFRSNTLARASGAFVGQPLQEIPPAGPPVAMNPNPQIGLVYVQGNGIFIGDQSATLSVGAGQGAGALGNLTVQSSGINGGPGNASINVSGGQFLVGGGVNISAAGTTDLATGDSEGGLASLTVTGGTVNVTGNIAITANATGSSAIAADGGTGQGGTATVDLLGGTITAGGITASANGFGGVGATGNDENPVNIPPGGMGGSGMGGNAAITIDGTANVQVGNLIAEARGTGGTGGAFFNVSSFGGNPGTPGNGGLGQGNSATITVAGGTLAVSNTLIADATGTGGTGGASFFSSSSGSFIGIGVGGTGGDGVGGTATLDLAAAITASATPTAVARGVGGNGGAHNVGGDGGDGTGGIAQLIVSGFDAGLFNASLNSSAVGGNGASGNDGGGGNGGDATGGTSRAQADGDGGSFLVRGVNFNTEGRGGNGGGGNVGFSFSPPTVAPSGGGGGAGTGGTLEVVATDGGVARLDPGSSGPQTFGSRGVGGNGGIGAGNFGMNRRGGDGGTAGGGTGGTVRLLADGGTISAPAQGTTITADGLSGTGGIGGTGTGGATNGAAGAISTTAGGRAAIEAFNGGTVTLAGPTVITASGSDAGRIELRAGAGSQISLATLDATALGQANPTNNDVEESSTGIFVDTQGGTIGTSGGASLNTQGSVGIYAEGPGRLNVGGNLTIQAGDQVDIRHDLRGDSAAPTVFAAGGLSATAVTSISGAPDSLLSAGATLTLTATGVGGTIGVDRLDSGIDTFLSSDGAAVVEHAEAGNDFTATVGSFRTGLNSIITDGDIDISSPGAVDLGNSTAGGFIQVNGLTIDFNSLTAAQTVNLIATGFNPGAEGVRGGSIAAGGDITIFGDSVDLTGPVTGDGSFFAFGTDGDVAVDQANVAGTISTFSSGNTTGTFVAGGNIFLNASGDITASAQANGGYVDLNGFTADGNLFVDAIGNVTLTDSSAARMFGVNTDGAATINGGTAGEDMLVLAGTTASLTNVTAGDNLTVQATGNITAQGASTTGSGADTHTLGYSVGSSSGVFTINVGEGSSATDGADIVLASAAGAIDASALAAGDDILLTAATTIAVNGATTLGLGITGGDSSIRTQGGATTLANLDAFSDIIVNAAGIADFTAPSTAGRDIIVTADDVTLATLSEPNGLTISTLSADQNLIVTSAGGISGGSVLALGDTTLTADAAIELADIGGGNVTLIGATGITAARVFSSGTTLLDSADGAITLGALVSSGNIDASAQSIQINDGNMVFSSLVTDVGDAVISGGDVFVIDGNVAGRAALTSTGERLGIDTLTAGSADLRATGGFLSLEGNVTTTGALTAEARGSILVNGVVSGASISLASSNIVIGPTARVGTAGVTQQLSVLNNNNDNQTFVGGTGTPNGFHIDAAELTRLFGSDIEIFAPDVQDVGGGSVGTADPPDVIVDSFTVTGGTSGSNLGANGSMTIRTPGKMRVIGNVLLTGLTDDNGLNLIGEEALEVILGQATVRLVNGSNPAGQLSLFSDDVIVATQAAITAVGATTTIDAINTRLGQNDGITLDEGALFAGGILASVDGGFYVQNSGAGTDFGQRRGLTFGGGGLTVSTGASSRIVINGVQLGPNGQVTGIDAISLLSIAPQSSGAPGAYDPRSTFNGCFIANPAACTVPAAPEFENSFPVQDVIEEQADPEEEGDGNTLPQPLITMRDLDPLTGEPLLDDPVTGAGNDDLWTPTTDTPTETP